MEEKPVYRAWFESLADPSECYELDEIVYTDSQQGLLQVAHDMGELAKTSAAEWKGLFLDRARFLAGLLAVVHVSQEVRPL